MKAYKRMICREAELSDYKAVCDITPNINEGMDYLPDKFHEMMHDKKTKCYVGILDERLVCFGALQLLRDGRGCISMSGRVVPELHNQGLSTALAYYESNHARKDWPEVDYFTSSALYNSDKHSNYPDKPGMMYFKKDELLYYIATKERLESGLAALRPTRHESEVRHLATSEAMKLVSRQHLMKQVIGQPYIMMYSQWGVIPNTPEDLRDAVLTHRVYVTPDNSNNNANNDIISISFGVVCKVPLGQRYNILYYGGGGTDDSLAHLTAHLRHAATLVLPSGRLGLGVALPLGYDVQRVKDYMLPLMGHNFLQGSITVENAVTYARKLSSFEYFGYSKL